MPKVKLSPELAEAQRATEVIGRNIQQLCGYYGMRRDSDLAAKTGLATKTVNLHRHRPELWTVGQLILVARALKTNLESLVRDADKPDTAANEFAKFAQSEINYYREENRRLQEEVIKLRERIAILDRK